MIFNEIFNKLSKYEKSFLKMKYCIKLFKKTTPDAENLFNRYGLNDQLVLRFENGSGGKRNIPNVDFWRKFRF